MKKKELKDKFRSFEEFSERTNWYGNETRKTLSAVSEINHRIPHLNSGWICWSGFYSLLHSQFLKWYLSSDWDT